MRSFMQKRVASHTQLLIAFSLLLCFPARILEGSRLQKKTTKSVNECITRKGLALLLILLIFYKRLAIIRHIIMLTVPTLRTT